MNKFILILFISLQAFAQNEFKLENNTLLWQHVINDSISIENIDLQLKNQGFKTYIENNLLNFEKTYTLPDLKNHGYNWGSFPTYLNNGVYFGFIQLKNNKYRITINSILLDDTLNQAIATELKEWIYKTNGTMRMQKSSIKVLNVFNSYFKAIFSPKPETSDW